MDYKKLKERLLNMEINTSDAGIVAEAADIITDYEQVTAQLSEVTQRYEMPEMAVRRSAGLYICPLCGKRTQVGHTHCHWCGKKLSWDREAYADRDYPHMGGKKHEKARRSSK